MGRPAIHVLLACACISQALASEVDNPAWGRQILRGWWNDKSSGPEPSTSKNGYDYVVIGSGPGGGPVASRLALAGHKVLVIEAGTDQMATNYNTTALPLNAAAAEDPKLSWEFWVNHYADASRAQRDLKYTYNTRNGSLYQGLKPPPGATPKGILYPRSAAVGGCTNHNGGIMVYPAAEDWDQVANITGDDSWEAGKMRQYFSKLENNQYVANGTRGHGFDGWLYTNRADPSIWLTDNKMYHMFKAAIQVTGTTIKSMADIIPYFEKDMNAPSPEYDAEAGFYNIPQTMKENKRSSPRDFLMSAAAHLNRTKGPGKLTNRTDCLATRIIFAPNSTRAVGVEFLDGRSLYRADPGATSGQKDHGAPGVAFANKEVILSGGTYNSPQLLKLSGIGPAKELSKLSIPTIVDLQGVGTNLQDRYENSIVSETAPKDTWTSFAGCTLGANASDPCLVEWKKSKSNSTTYATDGICMMAPFTSSKAPEPINDYVVFGYPGVFYGYFVGFSKTFTSNPNAFTWPVLKAHTQNQAGTVELLSNDPRDTPNITFNSFDTGSGDWEYDISATVEALTKARKILAEYGHQTGKPLKELMPGPHYNTTAKLKQWVKDTSWGHHASCSCPIGADDDKMAVLDSKFRVRGTEGLRVVDASVFPHIPGFFIQTSIFMISEKAADSILEDSGRVSPVAAMTSKPA